MKQCKLLQKRLFIASLLLISLSYSQDISDAYKTMDIAYGSPEATEMAKYGDLDVSLYKGVPNVSIPIHQFNLAGLTFPVSLQYNAGGITVDQVATRIGLGWTLHAGGQVTQSVYGENDLSMALDDKLFNNESLRTFYPNSYLGTGSGQPYNDYFYIYSDAMGGQMVKRNFKPDLYHYNYGGNNGKFLIHSKIISNGPFYQVPFTNHEIDYKIVSGNGQFEITDANGNLYIFDQRETSTTRQSCSGGLSGVNAFSERPTNDSYTWHLGKIITPNGDELRFTYTTLSIFTYQIPDVLQKYKFKTGDVLNCTYQNLQNYDYRCYVYKDVRPKVLNKIQWVRSGTVLEEVLFNDGSTRSDFGNSDYKTLSSIVVKKGGVTADTWNLTHGYFTSSGGSSQAYKRLKLLYAKQGSLPSHGFTYYQTYNLPHRGSLAQNHWGFYNGHTSNASLIPNTISGLTGTGNRGSDYTKMKAWSMTKHTYPTGGSTTFNMEGYFGGLRLNNMVDKDSDGSTIRTRYYTYGGYSAPSPNYHDDYQYRTGSVTSPYTCEYDTYSASPVPPVDTYNSYSVSGFSKVTILDEQNGSQGKTEVEFSQGVYQLDSAMYGADDVITWGDGERLKETTYNANNTIVNKKEYQFKVNHLNPAMNPLQTYPVATQPNEAFIYAMDVKLRYPNYGIANSGFYWPARFDIEKFRIVSAWYHPKTTIATTYDLNGQNPVVNTINYFYDNTTHALTTRSETVVSNGNTTIVKTSYPDDVSSTSSLGNNTISSTELTAINKLKKADQHRIAMPVQIETTEKNSSGTVLSKTFVRTNYKLEGSNLVVPADLETLKGTYNSSTNPEKKRVIYHDYDNRGNPIELSKSDGTHTFYIWGYNQKFPIAKIENATKSQVEALSAISTDYHSGSGGLPITQENAIRGLSNTMVTTYEFDPKAGVTKIKDPKGYVTTYHYDSLNRLQYVKDANGKILSETKYNYQ